MITYLSSYRKIWWYEKLLEFVVASNVLIVVCHMSIGRSVKQLNILEFCACPLRLKAGSPLTAWTAMKDSPLVGAGGRELHHHDVGIAGVALAVEVSALRVPTNNNCAWTVHLCQLSGSKVCLNRKNPSKLKPQMALLIFPCWDIMFMSSPLNRKPGPLETILASSAKQCETRIHGGS